MWAVIDELRAQVPLMASSEAGTPGFLPGTWTLDGHMMQVLADERVDRGATRRDSGPVPDSSDTA
jgi:hypothetical protein